MDLSSLSAESQFAMECGGKSDATPLLPRVLVPINAASAFDRFFAPPKNAAPREAGHLRTITISQSHKFEEPDKFKPIFAIADLTAGGVFVQLKATVSPFISEAHINHRKAGR